MHTTFASEVIAQYEHQPHFQSALKELLDSVIPYFEETNASDKDFELLKRITIPERVITFKVVWENDKGELETNLGYRVQFNSALGPYKGGLRFDPSVDEDILKFLGFEQIFKNALTSLPLGGGKGGSDFNPKGRSDNEIRRFCVAYMTELSPYIGDRTDIPAGDIGVGAREIGYLYGAYKKLQNRSEGVLTGKGLEYGGSRIRTEATGYGLVYFTKHMLSHAGKELKGMSAVVSGSGNVATHAAEKLLHEGAVPLTLSDRGGYIYAEKGITQELVDEVKELKLKHGSLGDLKLPEGITHHEGKVWEVKGDLYLPCATQHEIEKEDAEGIVKNGGLLVAEGANMPSTADAIEVFKENGVSFGPAKAANAGGVAVSGLEMSQNAAHLYWTSEEVDARLRDIMKQIHETCVTYGKEEDKIDYVKGANLGGFIKVFKAMKQLGW